MLAGFVFSLFFRRWGGGGQYFGGMSVCCLSWFIGLYLREVSEDQVVFPIGTGLLIFLLLHWQKAFYLLCSQMLSGRFLRKRKEKKSEIYTKQSIYTLHIYLKEVKITTSFRGKSFKHTQVYLKNES